MKSTFTLLLFLGLTSACVDTATTSDTVIEEPETVVTTDPIVAVEDETKGDNFTVRTVDAKPKSPRRELVGDIDGVAVTINYGSPAVNGREIYGNLVPFGKIWRTGANEATRITFDRPVLVGKEGAELAAGTYALFTQPDSREEWKVIFNRKADQWGAYDYDEDDDALAIEGEPVKATTIAENMNFGLENNRVVLVWDDLAIKFPVRAK